MWHVVAPPDQSDWSGKRRSEYAKYQAVEMGTPEAVLRIPALELAVPVFADTDRLSLELGAGWVHDTAQPGEAGNVAIAGHRDSFFRPLENIEVGAQIDLETASTTLSYEVVDISIVDALDISVLQPTQTHMLTLITCHPFRYKGFAPDRYIVRARLGEHRHQ
jgi:sortase A